MSDLKSLLTGIYQERGQLDGETIVAVAKKADHPLHDRFEWNDKVAGHNFRVIQAEQLIRSVKIQTTDTTETDGPHFVRAFVSNRQAGIEDRDGYTPIEEVVQDPLAYAMMLRAFKRQVNELHRRWGHLAEYRDIMAQEANGGEAS